MINTIMVNVFYYDPDYFDVDDVVSLQAYLKQQFPQGTVIICLPEGKVRLEQYPLREEGEFK